MYGPCKIINKSDRGRWLPICTEKTLYKRTFKGKKNGSGLLKNCGFVLERLTVLSISCLLGVTSDDL